MWKKILKAFLIVVLGAIIIRAIFVIGGLNTVEITGDRIALIEFDGTIMESQKFIEQLSLLKNDNNIKGIIISINSPGGAVTPSNEIYNYIMSIDKPVYAAMRSVAASGGYMMSLAADRIYAEPSTITGSIGVIMNIANMEGLFNKIGVKSIVLKSGKFKDAGNPDRPMTEEERALLMGVIMDMYDQFVEMVIVNRNMSKAAVLKVADGRIMTGRMAKEANLVDTVGSWRDAYNDMKNELGLTGIELYKVEKKLTWWEKMFEESIPERLYNQSHLRSGLYYLADIY